MFSNEGGKKVIFIFLCLISLFSKEIFLCLFLLVRINVFLIGIYIISFNMEVLKLIFVNVRYLFVGLDKWYNFLFIRFFVNVFRFW